MRVIVIDNKEIWEKDDGTIDENYVPTKEELEDFLFEHFGGFQPDDKNLTNGASVMRHIRENHKERQK